MKEEWKLAKENAYTDADADGNGSEHDNDKDGIEKEDNKVDYEQDDTDVDNLESKDDEIKTSIQTKLNLLLSEKLLECTNKQKADEFCVGYCFLHNKISKKKLIYALGRIPRHRSELSSTYSRVLASLTRIYPDFSQPVLDSVKREFYGIQKSKSQFSVEGKVMNIRYIGELIKFNIAPPILAYRIFKTFFADFSNHNVELMSMLLETCGRYLYLLPHTHIRMEEILDTMLRLRRVKNLNVRQLNMLETAYFAVKPPNVTEKVKTILTDVQKFTRSLILEKLDSANSVNGVIKCLRRLPWNNKECNIEYHFVKAVLRKSRTKIVTIPFIADCLSGLIRSCSNVIVCVVDRILEEIQRGLEAPHKREAQRMLGVVRLLGELYNFAVIPSTIIYDLLYHIINFGHDVSETIDSLSSSSSSSSNSKILNSNSNRKFDPSIPSDLDAPDDLFRVQMVCDLLNTCGVFYVRGPVKDKLNRFLVYFQRYLFSKPFIPMHIEFSILDTLDNLEQLCNASILSLQKKLGKKIKKKINKQDLKIEFNFTRFVSLEAAQVI
jgi:regulator of nonsense transcripts 2